jgi:hypothetical protein
MGKDLAPVDRPITNKKLVLTFIFRVIYAGLLVGLFGSISLIMVNEPLKFLPSAIGLKNFVELFAVPISCLAALGVVSTLDVAVSALEESALQRTTAAWEAVHNSFIVYATSSDHIPFSVLAAPAVGSSYSRSAFDGPMFAIQYPTPTVTLRRLLDPSVRFDAVHFALHPTLTKLLSDLDVSFRKMSDPAHQGNDDWLSDFAEFAVLVRRLREYLVVNTERITSWGRVSNLRAHEQFKSCKLPPYSSDKLSEICSDLRTELLCVAAVLVFASAGETAARRVSDMAVRVGYIWANASDSLKLTLQKPIEELWENPPIQGWKDLTV